MFSFQLPRMAAILILGTMLGAGFSNAIAQDSGAVANPEAGLSQAELQDLASASLADNGPPAPEPNAGLDNRFNFLELLLQGGYFMIPIGMISLLVVAIAFERGIALRKSRLFPRGLQRELRKTSEESGAVAPQGLYQVSEEYPSAASRILQDLLQKVGRPVAEGEAAIDHAVQREADELYGNVRWLTLAAAVTPLIGLLGTVWGMIIAFRETAELGAGMNKAEALASGIYVALITTLGGLAVAIPSAILAHYFEGRITRILANVEAAVRGVIPRFEDYEGRARYDISSRGLTRREVKRSKSNGASSPPVPRAPEQQRSAKAATN